MSGCIAFNASDSWHAGGWSYRAVIREICSVLEETGIDPELRRFLTEDVCAVEVEYFDLSAFSPERRTHFREAAHQGFIRDWTELSFIGPEFWLLDYWVDHENGRIDTTKHKTDDLRRLLSPRSEPEQA